MKARCGRSDTHGAHGMVICDDGGTWCSGNRDIVAGRTMTPYEMARDLAVYRLNTFRLMRRHALHPFTGSWRKPVTFRGELCAVHNSFHVCAYAGSVDRYVPEWVRRQTAKVLSGPTESELRAQWGDR